MLRTDTPSKLLLVADRRGSSPDGGVVVRRYRLARLRLEARPAGASPPLRARREPLASRRLARAGPAPAARYASRMRTELEGRPRHTPVLRKAGAAVVLVVAAVIVIKLVIGLVTAVFLTVVIAAVVIAILWALKTLIW